MESFRKVVRIGTAKFGKRWASVYAKIEFGREAEGRLTITGVEGPLATGNALGGCGQIREELSTLRVEEAIRFANGWNDELLRKFLAVWKRWHLNDMRAGSPAQEKYLREHPVTATYPASHYDVASKALAAAELNPDPESGYKYGSAWLSEPAPEDVLAFLRSLPNTDQTPHWV